MKLVRLWYLSNVVASSPWGLQQKENVEVVVGARALDQWLYNSRSVLENEGLIVSRLLSISSYGPDLIILT